MPHLINGLIDRCVDLLISDVSDLLCATIEESFELSRSRHAIPRRRDLLWRNGGNADLLISADWSAQELLDSGLHALWQIARLAVDNIGHAECPLPHRTKVRLVRACLPEAIPNIPKNRPRLKAGSNGVHRN
jgi:hypothetical protein